MEWIKFGEGLYSHPWLSLTAFLKKNLRLGGPKSHMSAYFTDQAALDAISPTLVEAKTCRALA